MRRAWKLGLALAACCGLGFLAWRYLYSPASPVLAAPAPRPPPSTAASTVADPLLPGRPAALDSARPPLAQNWVKAAPDAKLQYSLPASQRGGVEPCAVPAADAANRITSLSRGYLFTGGAAPLLDKDGNFDLVVHLHGETVVRRELLESGQPFALYTLTLPVSESYAPLFAGSGLLDHLIDEVVLALSKQSGVKASLRHLAVSAWSAGFEGVRSILYQPEAKRVHAVLLVDGLHAPRGQGGLARNLEPFIAYARRAQRGETWFAITHSSIPTVGYTSTTESAHFLINEVGGRPTAVKRNDGFGLELVDFYASGDLNVRGYAGNDNADHCAQLLLMRTLFTALHRHFHPG